MGKRYFAESELIINPDGSVFHLHVKPEQLAGKVILVGDPGRVSLVASHFDTKECEVESREFRTVTGTYRGKRITVTSTGIGCDNIDIVMNEMDALANIDFSTRTEKDSPRQLEIVRIGTCGGLQPYTPEGTFICSVKSVGFDGLLNFYEGRNAVCDLPMERALLNHLGWSGNMCAPAPYVIDADEELTDRIAGDDMVRGVTVACGGFFGPQGRQLRVPLAEKMNTWAVFMVFSRKLSLPGSVARVSMDEVRRSITSPSCTEGSGKAGSSSCVHAATQVIKTSKAAMFAMNSFFIMGIYSFLS